MGRVEAPQIAVHRIDAGDHSAGKVDEEAVSRECLQSEDAIFTRNSNIEQQPELLSHRIDHPWTVLERAEPAPQLALDTVAPGEPPERGKPTHAGQRQIGWPLADPLGTAPSNLPSSALPLVPLSPLAAESISTHLMDARRSFYLCHK